MSRKFWSPKGAVELAKALVNPEKTAPDTSPTEAPPIEPPPKLQVWSISPRNPHLVTAHCPGDDPEKDPACLVGVIVASNARFLRGMALPGPGRSLKVSGYRVYTLQGACPRYRGRW